MLAARELNAYDILCSDWVVFTKDSLPTGTPVGSTPAPSKKADAKAADEAAEAVEEGEDA